MMTQFNSTDRGSDNAGPVRPKLFTSDALLDGSDRLLIEHRGAIYQLRRTSNDRLLLTKECRDDLIARGVLP